MFRVKVNWNLDKALLRQQKLTKRMNSLHKQSFKVVLLNMFPERKRENSFVNSLSRVPFYKDMGNS